MMRKFKTKDDFILRELSTLEMETESKLGDIEIQKELTKQNLKKATTISQKLDLIIKHLGVD
jgi:hypothetical protein